MALLRGSSLDFLGFLTKISLGSLLRSCFFACRPTPSPWVHSFTHTADGQHSWRKASRSDVGHLYFVFLFYPDKYKYKIHRVEESIWCDGDVSDFLFLTELIIWSLAINIRKSQIGNIILENFLVARPESVGSLRTELWPWWWLWKLF